MLERNILDRGNDQKSSKGKVKTGHTKPSRKLISDLSFCVFDLETTGGNHNYDKIIEIGLVKIERAKIVDQVDYLIKPEIKIPEFIQKLTAITPSDVEDCVTIEGVIDEILEFMGDSILVAHNTSFDVPFFNSVLKRLDKPPLKNKAICTNLMTKNLIPNLMNSNLNYMSNIFGIKHNRAHRALDDAHATAKLLLKYLNIFIQKDIPKINHLYYPKNRYELDRIHYTKNTKEEIIINKIMSLKAPSVVTMKDEHGAILSSLPCVDHKRAIDLISKQLNKRNWETTTIKIYGPFIEALVHYRTLFSGLPEKAQVEAIKFLFSEHLPNEKIPNLRRATDSKRVEPDRVSKYDFLIAHHLIPEQLIIMPTCALHQNNQLTFRYPGHKKKLIQYINAKSLRISQGRIRKYHYHPMLQLFIDKYVETVQDQITDVFLFKRELPLSDPSKFLEQLDSFLSKNPNPYRYPREYI